VLHRYTPDRKGERCREHLSSFSGHLHADGYAGFAELYESAEDKPANVTEVACCPLDLWASGGHCCGCSFGPPANR
jgi:hypothetical protein